MTENKRKIEKESSLELVERLENGFIKRQKALINNIATTVIAAIILNIGATFVTINSTVARNTDRIARMEELISSEKKSQDELKEFVAALQVQYMYVNGTIKENKEAINKVNERIDSFIEKYYSGINRGNSKSSTTALKH